MITRLLSRQVLSVLLLDERTAPTITADQTDLAFGDGASFNLIGTGGTWTIKSIAEPQTGRLLVFTNVGSLSIYFADENTSGTANYRIKTGLPGGASLQLQPNQMIALQYSDSLQRWVVQHAVTELYDPIVDAILINVTGGAEVRHLITPPFVPNKGEVLGISSFDTSSAHNVFQDVTGGSFSVTLPFPQRVDLMADGTFVDDGSDRNDGQLRIHVTDSASAVTTYDSQYISGGNDDNASAITIDRRTAILPAGTTTIKLQARNQNSNNRVRLESSNIQAKFIDRG